MEALLFKLDKHLIGKQYIAGNRFTVADVAIGGSLLIISTCMPYVIPRFFHKAVECHGSEFSLGSGAFTLDGTVCVKSRQACFKAEGCLTESPYPVVRIACTLHDQEMNDEGVQCNTM